MPWKPRGGTDNFVNRFLSIFGGKVITSTIAIISTPVIVRLLGPSKFGDYAVLLSIFSLYMIPVSSGITEGIQKFVAEDRDAPHWYENVLRFYFILAILLVIAGGTLMIVFTIFGGPNSIFGDQFTLYFYLLVAFIVVAQFRSFSLRVILGFGLEPISESLKVVKKLSTVLLGITLVVLGYGVTGMLIGHIVASGLVAIIAALVIIRKISVPALFRKIPDSFPTRELLSFNGLNVVLVVLVMSLFHVDIIMLRSFTGPDTTGFYKAALALAEYLWFVPIALQTLLLHSTSRMWSIGSNSEITRLASTVTRYTVLLVSVMAIGLATLADRFVPLYYGEPFVAATGPLLLLLPGTVGFAAARPIQAICQGSGNLRPLVIATGGAAGLNFVLNLLLIPLFGMNGAAIATSIGYGSMVFLMIWAGRRIGFDPLDDFRLPNVVLTVIVTAPIIWLLERSISHDVVALIVVPPVGLLLFMGLAIITGAIETEELELIFERLPVPIRSVINSGRSIIERIVFFG